MAEAKTSVSEVLALLRREVVASQDNDDDRRFAEQMFDVVEQVIGDLRRTADALETLVSAQGKEIKS